MSEHEPRILRLVALQAALRDQRPRPDNPASWFVAGALLPLDLDGEASVERLHQVYERLNHVLGKCAAPNGSMRWLYAAIFASQGLDTERFFALRSALRDQRKASRTGSLHAGGGRAALLLSVSDKPADDLAEAFFAMKAALNPAILRRNPAITDTFCAVHVLKDDAPEAVIEARLAAMSVLADDRTARSYKRTGAKTIAAHQTEAGAVLAAFTELDQERHRSEGLKRALSRKMAMEWAGQGLNLSDGEAIGQIKLALPKTCGLSNPDKLRLAYVIYQADNPNLIEGSVNALASLIATQNAALVASMSAASTAATVTTTS